MLNAGFVVFASIVIGMRGDILTWLGVEREMNVSSTAPIRTVQKDSDKCAHSVRASPIVAGADCGQVICSAFVFVCFCKEMS